MLAKQIFFHRHELFKTFRKSLCLNVQFLNLKKCTKKCTTSNIRCVSSITQLKLHDQTQDFRSSFSVLTKELTHEIDCKKEMQAAIDQFEKVMAYMVPTGKLNRGLLLVKAYEMFEKHKNLTEENFNLVYKLAWAFEIMHGASLLLDDITDNGQTRRGAPCWHTLPEYQRSAVNDLLLLENATYVVLRKYLGNHPAYVQIIDMFHFFVFYSLVGQSRDILCLDSNGKPMLDEFTMDRYLATVQHKSAYYCFHVPVVLAMYLANVTDRELLGQVRNVTVKMGLLYQMQDDFLDCYGNPNLRGKVGDDIENGKCTWSVVVALEKANPSQRKILKDHYGRSESESVEKIKNLYEELNLPSIYAGCEQQYYDKISEDIEQMSERLPKELFYNLLNKIYKRKS